jgi:hypothetical protein
VIDADVVDEETAPAREDEPLPGGAESAPDGDEQPTAVFDAVAPATPAELDPPPAPAPQLNPETPEPAAEPRPAEGLHRRSEVRRRARYLRSLREVQLRDLGGFLVELRRFGAEREGLVEAKLELALATDHELRALEAELGRPPGPRSVREPGVGGACSVCGAVHGSLDRFCSSCGEPLRGSGDSNGDPLDGR